jgi:hypothetical protein
MAHPREMIKETHEFLKQVALCETEKEALYVFMEQGRKSVEELLILYKSVPVDYFNNPEFTELNKKSELAMKMILIAMDISPPETLMNHFRSFREHAFGIYSTFCECYRSGL